MNSDVKNMVKDSLVLFVITLIAGLVLGVVYQVTKDPIAAQQEKAKQEACKEVFADAASFRVWTADGSGASAEGDAVNTPQDASWTDLGFGGVDIGEVLAAEDDGGNVLGYVVTVNILPHFCYRPRHIIRRHEKRPQHQTAACQMGADKGNIHTVTAKHA